MVNNVFLRIFSLNELNHLIHRTLTMTFELTYGRWASRWLKWQRETHPTVIARRILKCWLVLSVTTHLSSRSRKDSAPSSAPSSVIGIKTRK